jgi:hypothetical protein
VNSEFQGRNSQFPEIPYQELSTGAGRLPEACFGYKFVARECQRSLHRADSQVQIGNFWSRIDSPSASS